MPASKKKKKRACNCYVLEKTYLSPGPNGKVDVEVEIGSDDPKGLCKKHMNEVKSAITSEFNGEVEEDERP